MVHDAAAAIAEFSRPVSADQIGNQEVTREIEASPAERAALAERLDLIALDALTATLRLRRLPDGLIWLSGRLVAEVVQSCVVTLAPIPSRCAVEFTMRFGAVGQAPESLREIEVASEGEDEPEPLVDGQIDLGESVVQQLAVSLDPYPRAPGAALPEALATGDDAEGPGGAEKSPFIALAKLKGGANGGSGSRG
jgi:uncharacterized metal-binding protein YceD (DUF177 family)